MQTQRGLQDTACPLYKKTAQIGITAPGDGPQMGLAAAPVLARRNPQTGGKLTTILELTRVADCGNNRIGSKRSNSGATSQASYRWITLALPSNLSFAFGQALIQYADLCADALRL